MEAARSKAVALRRRGRDEAATVEWARGKVCNEVKPRTAAR